MSVEALIAVGVDQPSDRRDARCPRRSGRPRGEGRAPRARRPACRREALGPAWGPTRRDPRHRRLRRVRSPRRIGASSAPRTRMASSPSCATNAGAARSRRSPDDPVWQIEVHGADPTLEHMHDTWLAMVDGVVGTLGSPLDELRAGPPRGPRGRCVHGQRAGQRPAPGARLDTPGRRARARGAASAGCSTCGRGCSTTRHAARGRHPGAHVRQSEPARRGRPARDGRGSAFPGRAILASDPDARRQRRPRARAGAAGRHEVGFVSGAPGGVAVAAVTEHPRRHGERRLDRLAAHVSRADRTPPPAAARGPARSR